MVKNILDVLEASGDLESKGAADIRKEVKKKNISIEDELISRGFEEKKVLEAKGEVLDVPTMYLWGKKVSFDILKYIPEESARHYGFVPMGLDGDVIQIGMVNPDDSVSMEALKFISSNLKRQFKIYLILKKDFDEILEEYNKGLSGQVSKALGELESSEVYEGVVKEQVAEKESAEEKIVEETPITKIFAVILRHATEGNASDIHIEPEKENLRVRFRMDGILHTSLILPLKVHESLVSRIKILANMQLDEKRKPQDGRFSAKIEKHQIDFRVSTFPTYFGEKVAIRILDTNIGVKNFEELGLEGQNLELVRSGIKKPYGLILITGPTGSGKSTTLYTMMDSLNKEKLNLVSLEDPIEYSIEGVNQSQVRPEIGYDFAQGIRHLLRQDPDIMMVGEIRDKETAKLAIHAALTGHLVLSTLHTKASIGVIPRLVDMGVDPYLIAPTLVMVLGQRLIRTLCDDSKDEVSVDGLVKSRIEDEIKNMPQTLRDSIQIPKNIYKSKSSGICPKGTKGRVAIFEVLYMTKELEKLILKKPSEIDIEDEAKRQGMINMKQSGILKVLKGTVGLEELSEVL